jgi:phosphoglycerol transferase MdoB-like AlkP superfamily enzyme
MRPLQFHRSVWAVLALGALGFLAFRLAQLLRYGDTALITGHTGDLARAFWMGARFDLKALSVMLLLFLGPASLIAVPALTRRVGAGLQRGAVAVIFFVVNFSAACQYFYYGFYRTPFTPIVFGLYEDDTRGIIASIWSDFPLVTAMLGVIAATAMQSWLVVRFASPSSRPSAAKTLAIGIFAVLVLGLLARGTLGTFPLRDQDATVSADPFVNDLVRNSLQTLYDSSRDRREQVTISDDAAARLPAYGFASLDDLAKTLGVQTGTASELEKSVFRHTPRNARLADHPPHVVFALMESWGTHALKFDSPGNNLAGAMARHLKDDFTFWNFFPAQNGTHPTLEALLLNSPLTPLTQGQYGLISFPAAAARPFKEQGYRTIFIYGGSNAWRSLGRALKHQYFDEVNDIGDILAHYPDAQRTVWGVYDEYLFRYAYDLLREGEARRQKIFLFLVSTTNHPPHSVPENYRPLPTDPVSMRAHLAKDVRGSEKQLQTFQYATHQLGLFLDGIEAGPLGRKTIVAATGDHNLRTLMEYRMPADSKDMHRVPGYFYVPSAYRPANPPDLDRYAGHRDMFPTLYRLALSDATYPAFGDDLFAPLPESRSFAMVGYQLLFSRAGALLPYVSRPAAFRWDDSGSVLEQTAGIPPVLAQQGERARALSALADWYTRYQVIESRKRAGRP